MTDHQEKPVTGEVIEQEYMVQFDVISADGTVRRANEGILFEADGEDLLVHVGTNDASVLFAAAKAILSIVKGEGLEKEFVKCLSMNESGDENCRDHE